MNTTTNTRGVSEAMVEQAERGWYSHIGEHGLDGSAFRDRLRAALEAALSPEPAAQGEAVAWMVVQKNRLSYGPVFRDKASAEAILKAEQGFVGDNVDEVIPLYTAPPAQPAERVPDGWVLVPREPTEEMLAQAATHDTSPRDAATDQWNRDTWNFMLDAAPEPPASPAPSPARGDGGEG